MSMQGLGRGLGQGLASLGQMMMQERTAEKQRLADEEAWAKRFGMQQQAVNDRVQAERDYNNEMVPAVPALGGAGFFPGGSMIPQVRVPRYMQGHATSALLGALLDAAGGDKAYDRWERQQEYLRKNGKPGGEKPRDPGLALGTAIGNADKVQNLWDENRPRGGGWAIVGDDPALRGYFEDRLTGSVGNIADVTGAMAPISAINLPLPDGYYMRGDTVMRDVDVLPDRPVTDEREIASLREKIYQNPQLAALMNTISGNNPGADPVPAAAEVVDLPGGAMYLQRTESGWVMVDRATGDVYEPTKDALKLVEGR